MQCATQSSADSGRLWSNFLLTQHEYRPKAGWASSSMMFAPSGTPVGAVRPANGRCHNKQCPASTPACCWLSLLLVELLGSCQEVINNRWAEPAAPWRAPSAVLAQPTQDTVPTPSLCPSVCVRTAPTHPLLVTCAWVLLLLPPHAAICGCLAAVWSPTPWLRAAIKQHCVPARLLLAQSACGPVLLVNTSSKQVHRWAPPAAAWLCIHRLQSRTLH
jgi:hypothetical protein